jgi:hypothetical protein
MRKTLARSMAMTIAAEIVVLVMCWRTGTKGRRLRTSASGYGHYCGITGAGAREAAEEVIRSYCAGICCASCVRTPACARVYGLPSFATSHSCPAQPSPVGANRPGWVADCAADPLKVATLYSSPSRGLPFFACLGSLYVLWPRA